METNKIVVKGFPRKEKNFNEVSLAQLAALVSQLGCPIKPTHCLTTHPKDGVGAQAQFHNFQQYLLPTCIYSKTSGKNCFSCCFVFELNQLDPPPTALLSIIRNLLFQKHLCTMACRPNFLFILYFQNVNTRFFYAKKVQLVHNIFQLQA